MQQVDMEETRRGIGTMKALVQRGFGPAREVLAIERIPTPEPGSGQVLVEVAAGSLNALDHHYLTGTPRIARVSMGWLRPRRLVPGADVSGTVVAVGEGVSGLSVGDEVFGDIEGGAFAEYVSVEAEALVTRPTNLGLVESSTLGVAALTALQGLRDWGGLEAGQSVLINGASGGVGTFAIQIARALGASHVTAVCSTANVQIARDLGADRVVDYTHEDFSRSGEKFDLLFDNAGSWSLTACRGLLTEKGTFVMVTGKKGQWFAPVGRLIAGRIRALAWSQSIANDVAKPVRADLETLRAMVESGSVRPVIDRRFSLDEAIEALEYQSQGHARGKSVVVP